MADEGVGRLSHRFLVFFGHLPTFASDAARCVAIVLSHLAENLDKVRYLDFALLLRGLDSQHGRLLVHVQEGLDHEVLTFVDEALTELLKFDEVLRSLVQHLDVLSSSELTFFKDSFLSQVLSDFVGVDVGVIFADLADEGLCRALGLLQEGLLRLENFFLYLFWRVNVEHAWQSHQQELLVMSLKSGEPDGFENGINAPGNLPLEATLL